MRARLVLLLLIMGVLSAACGYAKVSTGSLTPNSWTSPAKLACGRSFFPKGQLAQLRAKFGSTMQCFRFRQHDQWILVGNGATANRRGETDIGPMVAVETCRNLECLDPDAAHPFAAFKVSYPPNSLVTMDLQATHGSNVLVLANCHLFDFDTTTLKWYPDSHATIERLLSGQVAAPIATSPPIGGLAAYDGAMPTQYENTCR